MPLETPAPVPGQPVFDPFDPTWATDPFPLYADLRERAPVHRSELGFWVVARHADCLAVLRDRRIGSDSTLAPVKERSDQFRWTPTPEENPMAAGMVEMRPFLFREPPDHTRLRSLVSKAFTPKMVESMRSRTEEIVDELLDAALEAGEFDLVDAFAYPLPVRIICELLGIPVEDHDRFRDWSHTLARGLDPDFLLTEEIIAERGTAAVEFAQYFFELLAERRRSPGDDLISRLVAAEHDGAALSESELLSTCILLLMAGHETTVNSISAGVLELLNHPDQLELFRTDPGMSRSGIEELLRYTSPVHLTGRWVTEDLTLGGMDLAAGDFVLVLLASGNRDPEVFADPDALDLARHPNNHLGFGFGIHHCMGMALARMETEVALTTLFRRAPRLGLVADEVAYRRGIVLRGPEALPVTTRG